MLAHPTQHDCTFTTFPQPWHPSGAVATSWSVPSTCDLVPPGLGVQSTACVPMCTGEGTEQSELQLAPEQGAGRADSSSRSQRAAASPGACRLRGAG